LEGASTPAYGGRVSPHHASEATTWAGRLWQRRREARAGALQKLKLETLRCHSRSRRTQTPCLRGLGPRSSPPRQAGWGPAWTGQGSKESLHSQGVHTHRSTFLGHCRADLCTFVHPNRSDSRSDEGWNSELLGDSRWGPEIVLTKRCRRIRARGQRYWVASNRRVCLSTRASDWGRSDSDQKPDHTQPRSPSHIKV
jgi:hypothetical protein